MKSRFLPAKRELPLVEPSGIHVFFQPAIEERLADIKSITPSHLSFAERINRELERISSYYEAIGLWVHFEHRSVLLADKIGLTKDQYRDALAAAKMNSVLLFEDLLGRAEHAGLAPDLVAKTISEAQYIDPKPTARQRMLMMRTVMNSTPVVIADLFSRARVGSYGFGDGTTTQIFQGKTRIGDVAFSAIASPRLFQEKGAPESGYVFRFCVGKCELSGFEEDHPLYMLDTKVVESLTEWHRCCFPEQPLNQNPLLVAMARLLMVSTHDWGHSWLLYDRDAQTPEFQQWGNDIYTVPHVIQNKLLINYEVITASMHRYTWRLLFDNRPGLEPSIQSELQRYHEAVLDFAAFVEGKFGQERASQEENYLMYIPLSNLPCVLDWRTPAVNSLFERYPVVCEHVIRRLGPFFEKLSSNNDGVPAQSREGGEITTAEYIREYPLGGEMAARLRRDRVQALFKHGGGVSGDPFRAFKALPDRIANQFGAVIPDPSVLPSLVFALDKLREDLGDSSACPALMERLYERVRVISSGHLFFRLERREIDYEQLTVCEQDKRVLLVEVPAGITLSLRPRIATNLMDEVTKQITTATDQDMIAFNVQNERHAAEILQAASGVTGIDSLNAMISKGNELARTRSVAGAQDIYPLRRVAAERLYGAATTGYRELLARKRLGCATCGPIELPLHDGSDQRTLSGVLVYVPPEDQQYAGNDDPDPDMHGIEAGVFDRTYSAAATSMSPFMLRPGVSLVGQEDPALVSRALHRFIRSLEEINLQLDLGSSASEIGKGLFSEQ